MKRSWAAKVLKAGTIVVLLAAGCSSGGNGKSSGTTRAKSPTTAKTSAPHTSRRIVVVVEENHSFSQIIGSAELPRVNQMAKDGVLLGQYYAITHPSLPNYIAMVSGDTHGVTSDCGKCNVDADNLGSQLQKAHIPWKVYAQGLPRPCADEPQAGAYAKKHVPFLYFNSLRADAAACANVVPFTQFAADARAGRLPAFVFIVPDLSHDMHGAGEGGNDVTLKRSADAFAGQVHDDLASSPAWREDTRLVVTWDEGGGGGGGDTGCCGGRATGGHVPTIVVGPQVKPGQDATPYDHYSLLRSIETVYGLAPLAQAGDPTSKDIPAIVR